jgi:protein-S-isoprenylcysteine O-methyltransferase Ste14
MEFKMTTQSVPQTKNNKLARLAAFVYGLVCYAIFFGTFLYAVGFIGGFIVPKTIDSAPLVALPNALLINLGLLSIFAVQHSAMARPAFKRQWTKIVPKPVERSTYVLFSSLCLAVLFYFWQPMGITIWNIQHPVAQAILYSLYVSGWLVILGASFLINHFDLFGLRQVFLYLIGQPYNQLPFVTPGLYKHVRHPLYVGWLLAFWATPHMTAAHLVFALATTAYILTAIQFEERDLVQIHGENYVEYRRRVPMLIPALGRRTVPGALPTPLTPWPELYPRASAGATGWIPSPSGSGR